MTFLRRSTRRFLKKKITSTTPRIHSLSAKLMTGMSLNVSTFRKDAIKECGVNGICNEDLLIMVVRRLEGFQNSEFKCRENALALTHIEEALLWLRKRTMGRENRGVEGTHTV